MSTFDVRSGWWGTVSLRTAQRGQVESKTQLGIIRKFARHAPMLETWALQGHVL